MNNIMLLYFVKYLKNYYISTYLSLFGYIDDKEYYYQIKRKYPNVRIFNLYNNKYLSKNNIYNNRIVFINSFIWLNRNEQMNEQLLYTKHIFLSNKIYRLTDSCFHSYNNLKSICFPYKLLSISNNCFYNCKSLYYVYLPQTINIIGNKTFYNCININYINIPKKINKLGEYIVYNCTKLKYIKILPLTLKLINKNTFKINNKKNKNMKIIIL